MICRHSRLICVLEKNLLKILNLKEMYTNSFSGMAQIELRNKYISCGGSTIANSSSTGDYGGSLWWW